MTGKEFVDYIRHETRTNANTFTDAEIILVANVKQDTLSRAVMGSDEDTLVLPMSTNLRAGAREYPFPRSILSRIKYVEAKFDGTSWTHLEEFDLNQNKKPTDETNILNNFNNGSGGAFYDIDRKSLWLYSGEIKFVEKGLKLWCNIFPAKLNIDRISDNVTDLSTDPTVTENGFPRELHELWARAVIIDFKESREKPIPLNQTEQIFKLDLQMAIQDLKHGNLDRVVYMGMPVPSDRGNNGQDY